MAQNVRINSINSFQVAIESSMQDGAVEEKEPLQRSEALEDPEAIAEILIEIRRPRLIIESIVKARAGPKKFEKSDIELFVVAAYEDADETADEVIIEKTVIESIIETILEEADKVIEIEETSE